MNSVVKVFVACDTEIAAPSSNNSLLKAMFTYYTTDSLLQLTCLVNLLYSIESTMLADYVPTFSAYPIFQKKNLPLLYSFCSVLCTAQVFPTNDDPLST